MMTTLIQDLKFGLRMLAKNPGFTAVAVLTLALGIGANTAIFSLIDAVLLKMLPVRNPEQLLWVVTARPDGTTNDAFSYPTFQQLAERNQALSGVLAFRNLGDLDLAVGGEPGLVKGQAVSGNYFTVLGVTANPGRTLAPEDNRVAGGSAVAVIGYDYWTRRFNRDPSVVGRAITLNGSPFTIIGVTPPEFFGLEPGESVDISIPITMVAQVQPEFAAAGSPYDILNAPFRNWLYVMARLKNESGPPGAVANLEPVYDQAKRQAEEGLEGVSHLKAFFLESRIQLEPGSRGLTALRQQFSKPLLVLMAIVGLLLLIACANVANLLLARANSRQKEIALRMALGAGRPRLVRQLLTESVLLALAGGAFGAFLAYWGSSSLMALMSRSSTPVLLHVAPDARVLAFTALSSLFAALVFGLAPAWGGSRLDLSRTLKDGARSSDHVGLRSRLGRSLVLVQVALSIMLLVGAGLLLRSLAKLRDFYPGFNRQNVLLFSINPNMAGYKDAQASDLYQRLLERTKALPGVSAASFSMFTPLSPHFGYTLPTFEGFTRRPGETTPVNINTVGPEYFKALGTPILLGREFTTADGAGTPRVAVVNEAMAQYFFGDSNPLGRRFSIPGWKGDASMLEIVGVAQNTKSHSLREPTPPAAYVPFFQSPDNGAMTFEVRTAANPARLAIAARRIVQEADSRLPVFDVKTLTQQLDESLVQERLVASLSILFGVLALLLTCVGLYGLMAYSVARRTHEIGIRMALGANRVDLLELVVGEGFKLTLAGVGLGIAGALVLTRFLTSLLFGVKATDPLTFVMVSLLLIAVALLACYIPARRATKVDPIVALRYE